MALSEDCNNNNLQGWIKSKWASGSVCEVYCGAIDCWNLATIQRLFCDSKGKWAEIQHQSTHESLPKYVLVEDVNAIRPLSQAMSIYEYIYYAVGEQKHKAQPSSCIYNDGFNKCASADRIKSILVQYNKTLSNESTQSGFKLTILNNEAYCTVDLLNDFYHIKYDHNTN
eukprot:511990_1